MSYTLFSHLVSTGFLDCRCPGAVKAAFLIIYYFNGTDNSKNPVEVRWKKVCGSKCVAALSSSPPTEFIMYDHSKKRSLGCGNYSSEVYESGLGTVIYIHFIRFAYVVWLLQINVNKVVSKDKAFKRCVN